jgi:hypothetical protein
VSSARSAIVLGVSRQAQWLKTGVFVGAMQALIQGIGFICGLIVVRLLSTSEYALYTLGAAAISTALLLADSGVANGVMAEGGKVFRDPQALANVVATGIKLRKKFSLWALAICIPILGWILRRHGASWINCGLITATVFVAFLTSLTGAILEIPLKLRQDLSRLQRIQVRASLLRLLAVACSIPFLPFAPVGLAANGVAQAWTNRKLRAVSGELQLGVSGNSTERAILRLVKLTLPAVIYYSVSGQLTIWLLSLFGSTTAVAQVGALSRLAAVLALIGTWFNLVVVPRFARLENRRRTVFTYYFKALALLVVLSIVISGFVGLFPDAALSVLGPRYRNLHQEALLITIATCFGAMAGSLGALVAARGLILTPLLAIPIGVAATLVTMMVNNVSTSVGVLTMALELSAFGTLFALISGLWLIRRSTK